MGCALQSHFRVHGRAVHRKLGLWTKMGRDKDDVQGCIQHAGLSFDILPDEAQGDRENGRSATLKTSETT